MCIRDRLLTTSTVYQKPLTFGLKKNMMTILNQRPDNIDGKNIRFIILDSGYKEGIDLFDVKYVHIFEPANTIADLKQVIGRATRTCGQRGLDFIEDISSLLEAITDIKLSVSIEVFVSKSKIYLKLEFILS